MRLRRDCAMKLAEFFSVVWGNRSLDRWPGIVGLGERYHGEVDFLAGLQAEAATEFRREMIGFDVRERHGVVRLGIVAGLPSFCLCRTVLFDRNVSRWRNSGTVDSGGPDSSGRVSTTFTSADTVVADPERGLHFLRKFRAQFRLWNLARATEKGEAARFIAQPEFPGASLEVEFALARLLRRAEHLLPGIGEYLHANLRRGGTTGFVGVQGGPPFLRNPSHVRDAGPGGGFHRAFRQGVAVGQQPGEQTLEFALELGVFLVGRAHDEFPGPVQFQF